MIEKRTIARPYARAAFEFATGAGTLEGWGGALNHLAEVVSDPEAQKLIRHPRATDAQVTDAILAAGSGVFTGPMENFVRMLVRADRVILAPQIRDLFEGMQAEARGVSQVEVVSAYDLDDGEQSKIEQAVREHLGRSVAVSVATDKALIGGAVVRAGDKVIDLSVRGRLAGLNNQLSR